MFSPRRIAQLGLVSSSLVLIVSVGVLATQGRDKSSGVQAGADDRESVTGSPVSLSAQVPTDHRVTAERPQ